MDAADAVEIVHALGASGVEARVGGGWAVDALLRRQTRPHGDLDLWLPAVAFDRSVVALVSCGVDRLYPWGDERPWNFVLHDGARRRVDLHLYEVVDEEWFHYGSVRGGERFPVAALAGSGEIAGCAVRCESPEWSLRWHSGHPPRDEDLHDVHALCDEFGFELPAGFDRH